MARARALPVLLAAASAAAAALLAAAAAWLHDSERGVRAPGPAAAAHPTAATAAWAHGPLPDDLSAADVASALPPTAVDLAFCAIVRNEDDALEEWLSYHLAHGAGLFHLYHLDDHDARNRWRDVLWPFVARGVVRMHAQRVRYAGQLANRQSASLKACLRELAGRARWIAFLDVDEFLVPPPGRTVLEELARFDDKPGLFLPWRILGPGPNSSEPDVEHLPLHRVLNAADDSGTNMLNLLGKGKLLLRAAHPGAARACEHFMNLKPGHSASLTINYVHNCLAWSGMLPVDPQGREAGDPLMAPIPIRKTGLKLFHYFARSCADFEARRPTRLSYYRTLHGTDPEPGGWFRGRTGDRLGNTTAERCAALRRHFSEEERGALAHLGLLAQERARVSSAPVPPLLPRAECGRCDPKATCVDLLGTAECVCEARYEGNGRFCGDMVWAGNVLPKIGHWEKESARGPEGTLHVPSGEGWNGTVVLDFGEARLARAVRLYLQDGACGVTDVAVRGLSLREWEELAVPGADRGKVCVPNGEIEVEVRLLAPAAVARVRVGVRQGSVLAAAGLLVEA